MSADCCGLIKFMVDYFQFQLTAEETYQRIEDEAKQNRPAGRTLYWDTVSYATGNTPSEFFTALQRYTPPKSTFPNAP